MGWQDDVKTTWRDVGRVVGAKFYVTQDGGKLVRRSEEWIVTLEYSAKSIGSIIYGDGFSFHTTTTMKAIPNRKKASEYEIFKEVSKEKAPRGLLDGLMHTVSGDPHPDRNWMLPIYDYTRLLTLFRLIDVPKRWSEKRQAWELQEKERKVPRKERTQIEAERHAEWQFQNRLQNRQLAFATLTGLGINARLADRGPEIRRPDLSHRYDGPFGLR